MDINNWITYKARKRWTWEKISQWDQEWEMWYKHWLKFRKTLTGTTIMTTKNHIYRK